jgi:hypothetical protein
MASNWQQSGANGIVSRTVDRSTRFFLSWFWRMETRVNKDAAIAKYGQVLGSQCKANDGFSLRENMPGRPDRAVLESWEQEDER